MKFLLALIFGGVAGGVVGYFMPQRADMETTDMVVSLNHEQVTLRNSPASAFAATVYFNGPRELVNTEFSIDRVELQSVAGPV
jgi:hypothetical protein